jgi:hypothetical protein
MQEGVPAGVRMTSDPTPVVSAIEQDLLQDLRQACIEAAIECEAFDRRGPRWREAVAYQSGLSMALAIVTNQSEDYVNNDIRSALMDRP